ncbi:hypothetical protein N0V82_006420 [Gnomoniopsis sp. IMI 355080]|nr:hypothetical protein N0V82_006420 [Gnomoniopsis sp. IMI 355080]
MPRDIITQNFLYGDHGHKKRRASIWGCKRPGASPSNSHSTHDAAASYSMSGSSGNTRHGTLRTAQGDRRSPPRLSEDRSQTPLTAVRFQQSEPRRPDYISPGMLPSQPEPFTVHPFSRLSKTVKQCPWMLGSDVNQFAPNHNPDFYLPVPRSIKHDTAVSFVVTDQTRPEQPQFVISCALEHVDLVRETLAPNGSQRALSARGSSGHPRDSAELRSMLLDGTPNIELALHGKPNTTTAHGSVGPSDSQDRRQLEGEGSGAGRRHSFVRERPLGPFARDQNVEQRIRSQEGCAPQDCPTPFVPAMFVPHGWYSGPNYQEPRVEQAAPASVNP